MMRWASQARQNLLSVVKTHEQSVHNVCKESALWVGAWRHAWTRNILKQHNWMQQTLQHYRAKGEALWVRARKEVTDGANKEKRTK